MITNKQFPWSGSKTITASNGRC